jgi:virginiamycin B lyase
MRAALRVIGISLLALGEISAVGAQDAATPPAMVIPLGRLKADATVPVRMAAGAGAAPDAVWMADADGGGVVRVDARTSAAGTPIPVGGSPCASLALDFGSLWVPLCGATPRLARVDPAKGTVTATLEVGPGDAGGRIATGVGSVWVPSDAAGVLSRIDPDTNGVVAEIYVAGRPSSAVLDGDALWVTSAAGDVLAKVSPHSTEVGETLKVGGRPGRLAAGDEAVWVLNHGDGTVSRVAATTGKLVATIRVADGPVEGDIAVGAGSVWVSVPGAPIVRIDPRTNRVAQRFTGEGGGAVLVAHGSLWVNAGAATWRLDPKLVAAMRPD